MATVLCVRAGSRETGQLRAFWWLLAAAAGAFTLGESIWAVYDLVLREEVPVPSWADLGYLSGIPLAVAALLAHPAVRGGGVNQAREVFDGLLVATSLLFLSWTFVLGPLWKSTDLTTAGGLVAMAYPFGDVVIVFFVVLAVRRMSGKGRLPLWLLLGGLLAMALADSTYVYLIEADRYATGDLVDSGWIVAYLGNRGRGVLLGRAGQRGSAGRDLLAGARGAGRAVPLCAARPRRRLGAGANG